MHAFFQLCQLLAARHVLLYAGLLGARAGCKKERFIILDLGGLVVAHLLGREDRPHGVAEVAGWRKRGEGVVGAPQVEDLLDS